MKAKEVTKTIYEDFEEEKARYSLNRNKNSRN